MDELNYYRGSYEALTQRACVVLLAQGENAEPLNALRTDTMQLMAAAERNVDAFPAGEYNTLCRSVETIIGFIDDMLRRINDPPDNVDLTIAGQIATGGPGRPRFDIDSNFLAFAQESRGWSDIARSLGCSARTVRRRAVGHGLVPVGRSPFRRIERPNGDVEQIWDGPIRRTQLSDIADVDLDRLVTRILMASPNFGRRMIDGALRSMGVHVTRRQIKHSYYRVHGAPPTNNSRRIRRRQYAVAGVNSMWHHDGQHGLIRYKFVTHVFIDGKSRFILGAQVHTNNRSATVLALFLQCLRHGVPRKVRGDHGVENVEVARRMDVLCGQGTYIWGRSVHNTRSERLWRDYNQSVGNKWKDFFTDLEQNCNLDPDNEAHIRLLHWLFLDAINADLQEWVNAWNSHKISGEERSPRDMFIFGMLEDGPRGIDHEAFLRANDMGDAHNEAIREEDPAFPPAFQEGLQRRLEEAFGGNLSSSNMIVRRLLWQTALEIGQELAEELGYDFV